MGWRQTIVAGALAFSCLGVGTASACEEFADYPPEELKALRDKLVEQETDPLDRMFAFQQLACSSNPVMRAYAVREGLKSSSDPIVRQQIMFDAFMQKTRVEIELTAGPGATAPDKAFIKQHSGIWVLPVTFRSRSDGCVSLYYQDRCDPNSSLFTRGEKIELGYDGIVGEFYLSDSNDLLGYIRVRAQQDSGRIPAIIKLN